MKACKINDGATTFTRVSKREARKLFDSGESIYVIAHKMRPGYPFSLGITINKSDWPDDERNADFDYRVRWFICYNCDSFEVGYYPAFYTCVDNQADKADDLWWVDIPADG